MRCAAAVGATRRAPRAPILTKIAPDAIAVMQEMTTIALSTGDAKVYNFPKGTGATPEEEPPFPGRPGRDIVSAGIDALQHVLARRKWGGECVF